MACSDAARSSVTAPDTARAAPSTIAFRLDGETCAGTHMVSYYVDDDLIGSWQTTAGGDGTPALPITPGTHAFRAELSDHSAMWGPLMMDIPSATALTIDLNCR